jgi:uncharacterized protein (DUF58 family)
MMILRALILGLGALLILGGFAAIAVGGWVGLWGLWLVVGGLVIVAAVLLERRRYRSVAAEVGPEPPGPGGGEPLDQPLEPRFSPTTERFVDPTTGITMRVWVDTASGDRRYRADR